MGKRNNKEEFAQSEFFDIVKKAYDRGVNDQGLTVAKLIEDLKIDLKKIKGE
jgi:hypothetical protein